MEDLASMITQFLGSEDGMNQLRAVTEALGLDSSALENGGAPAATASGTGPTAASAQGQQAGAMPDLGGLFSSLGGAFNGSANPSAGSSGSSGSGLGGFDLNTMMLLGKAASALGQDDRNTELLRALKPHFSAERAKKVDDAIRIMQLIRLLPLVKELGFWPLGKGGEQE